MVGADTVPDNGREKATCKHRTMAAKIQSSDWVTKPCATSFPGNLGPWDRGWAGHPRNAWWNWAKQPATMVEGRYTNARFGCYERLLWPHFVCLLRVSNFTVDSAFVRHDFVVSIEPEHLNHWPSESVGKTTVNSAAIRFVRSELRCHLDFKAYLYGPNLLPSPSKTVRSNSLPKTCVYWHNFKL